MSIFQSITSNDISVTAFKAYKLYQETQDTINVLKGVYSDIPYNLADINNPVIQALSTSSGFYDYLIFDAINHSYYNSYDLNPYNVLDVAYKNEKRIINASVNVISIPQSYYGEQIKENTISITNGITTIIDDGNGNLIDTELSQSMTISGIYDELSGNCIGYWPVNDIFQSKDKSTDYSAYNNEMTHYGVTSVNSEALPLKVIPYYSASYSRISNINEYDFNSDYSILLQIEPDLVQSNATSSLLNKNGLLRNPDTLEDQIRYQPYPFQLDYLTDGSNFNIVFSINDGNSIFSLSSDLIDISYSHMISIFISKNDSAIELFIYATNSSGAIIFSNVADYFSNVYISNQCEIILGMNGNNTNHFLGSIYNLRFTNTGYFSGLNSDNYIALGFHSGSNDYYVGNAFYKTGQLVITSQAPKYEALINDFDLQFKGSKTIHEFEINCTIPAGELNYTLNPSSLENPYSSMNKNYHGYVSSSNWSPYITQVGLYNDNLDLLAVAKMSTPIKTFNDIDMTFIIKFDI